MGLAAGVSCWQGPMRSLWSSWSSWVHALVYSVLGKNTQPWASSRSPLLAELSIQSYSVQRSSGRLRGSVTEHSRQTTALEHSHLSFNLELLDISVKCLVTYHTVDKNAERNPEYQGENQDGPYDVVCQKLPCEQFQTVNVSTTYLTSRLPNTLEYHGQIVFGGEGTREYYACFLCPQCQRDTAHHA